MDKKQLEIKKIRKSFPYAKIIDYSELNLFSDEVYLIDLDELIKDKVEELSGEVIFYFDVFSIVGLYNKDSFFLKANYSIKKIENNFLINIKLSADIDLECDLCGRDFVYTFKYDIQEIHSKYNFSNFQNENSNEIDNVFLLNSDQIDIGKIIIENFISNLPLKFSDNCRKNEDK